MTLNFPTEVVINPLALAQIEREMILPDLMRRGQRVQSAARAQIRIGHIHAGRSDMPGRSQSSIPLADSIVKRAIATSRGPGVRVGSASEHALYVHNGTRPHIIQARNKLALYFYSGGFGGFVLVPLLPQSTGSYVMDSAGGIADASATGRVLVSGKGYVNHPGYAGNRFLTDNLGLAVL